MNNLLKYIAHQSSVLCKCTGDAMVNKIDLIFAVSGSMLWDERLSFTSKQIEHSERQRYKLYPSSALVVLWGFWRGTSMGEQIWGKKQNNNENHELLKRLSWGNISKISNAMIGYQLWSQFPSLMYRSSIMNEIFTWERGKNVLSVCLEECQHVPKSHKNTYWH